MENSFDEIKVSDFYNDDDKDLIRRLNDSSKKEFDEYCKRGDPYFIDMDLLPEPFMGNPDSKIIFLFSNPGLTHDKKELQDYKETDLKNAIKNNLTGKNEDYPYYYLSPKFHKTAGGRWILDRMDSIIDTLKIERDEELVWKGLSRNIFSIQLHPFHTREYKTIKEKFSWQEKMFELFIKAAERVKKGEAIMICTRSYKEWNMIYNKATKENLDDLPKGFFTRTKNARSTYLTKNNFENGEVFERLIEILRKGM